ncbi:MAG: hypothetical protein DI498_10980 [Paracoccus denitrificans]|nr:MAG: hypothetical protein DI498_10980 [Paracoccus denitrificans]PZO83665.1 MAG: hypothetical protein DI633_10980 [Paracoccus denitrificans]
MNSDIPSSGGRWSRDSVTGALTPLADAEPAPAAAQQTDPVEPVSSAETLKTTAPAADSRKGNK